MENESEKEMLESVPKEIDNWNWGAFFLNGFWGIGNKTYIALLAFIPVLNIIMMVILGAKGNRMAWHNKEWESVEHFKSVQDKWNKAGMAAFVLYFILFLLELWKVL